MSVDTSTDAVERILAELLHGGAVVSELRDTFRALAAERDALRALLLAATRAPRARSPKESVECPRCGTTLRVAMSPKKESDETTCAKCKTPLRIDRVSYLVAMEL